MGSVGTNVYVCIHTYVYIYMYILICRDVSGIGLVYRIRVEGLGL